jgi:glycosyltransferase involved in cell wall biosynthesis
MKILFLTQWFDPEPTFKGLAFARELVRRGHEVEVLTGFPNYPEGRLYPGYRVHVFRREMMEGIRVTRVALYPSHDRSAIRRVLNYVSFALSSALLGPFLVRRADVAYVYHPPPTVGLAAILLKWFRGIPFVYDIQDLWPDTLAATGMVRSRALLGLVGMWCRVVYSQASKIIVLSPGFKRKLTERGVPVGKTEVIYNWCDETAICQGHLEAPILTEAGVAGRFNVVFAGTMGKAQALSSVLQAAQLVAERNPRVQFVFVGGGVEVEGLKGEAASRRQKNVRFLPVRPAAEVGPLLAAADVLLVHLKDDPLFAITIPSKTQAYLAVGRPVLMAVRGDAANLVREAGAGVCVNPADPDALAAAVCTLAGLTAEELTKMGEYGRAFYREHLSLRSGSDRFENLLRNAGCGA